MGKASRRKRERRLGIISNTPDSAGSALVVGEDPLAHLKSHRAAYARAWSEGDAKSFEADGHYSWMSRFVAGFTRVFEVGVGDGRSTLELLNQGHVVVGIDENPACLDRAEERIRSAGYSVSVVRRQTPLALGRGHALAFVPADFEWPERGALLVEADLLNDPSLWDWAGASTADAVVCWLMGTHNARERNDYIAWLRVRSSGEYRLRVENKVYQLADRLLRPGGILHLVRRGESTESALIRDDVIRGDREQAAVTSLVVQPAIEQRAYEQGIDGVGCTLTLPSSGRIPNMRELFLVSIRALKPGALSPMGGAGSASSDSE